MKFTIDTTSKTIVLLQDMTLGELNVLKNFIGDDWHKWTIRAVMKAEQKLPDQSFRGKYPFIHYYHAGSLKIQREDNPYGVFMVEGNSNSLTGITIRSITDKCRTS